MEGWRKRANERRAVSQGSAVWFDIRNTCAVTCSNYASAIGVGYSSRRKYMKQRLGLLPRDAPNDLMAFGNEYENWVAKVYQWIMTQARHSVQLHCHGFCFDPCDDRLGGSIDRIAIVNGEFVVLECKTCPQRGSVRHEVPVSHLLQMVGLMHAYELSKAHYISWTPEHGVMTCEVTYDATFWTDWLYPRLCEFADWYEMRVIPPKMSSAEKQRVLQAIDEHVHVTPIPGT